MEADGTVSEVKVAHTGDPEVSECGRCYKPAELANILWSVVCAGCNMCEFQL